MLLEVVIVVTVALVWQRRTDSRSVEVWDVLWRPALLPRGPTTDSNAEAWPEKRVAEVDRVDDSKGELQVMAALKHAYRRATHHLPGVRDWSMSSALRGVPTQIE